MRTVSDFEGGVPAVKPVLSSAHGPVAVVSPPRESESSARSGLTSLRTLECLA